jgi:hypothetical protein
LKGDPFPAAQLGNAVLTPQVIQHNADLLFRRKPPSGRPADVFDKLLGGRFARPGFLSAKHPNRPMGADAAHEIYPALWSRGFAREGRTGDQHDAYVIAAWLSPSERDGSLAAFLNPSLTPPEQTTARVEGWILGVT